MMVQVDDIKFAATEEVAEVVFSTGSVLWHMGRGCKRDSEKGTFQTTHIQFIRSLPLKNRFDVAKSSPIPATPSLDLRIASERETFVDMEFREIVGSLMWMANHTRPDPTSRMYFGQSRGFHMIPSCFIARWPR